MKKIASIIIVLALICGLLVGCASEPAKSDSTEAKENNGE